MVEPSVEPNLSMSPALTPMQEEEKNPEENIFGIDSFLLTALENPRDRLTILKLDQELEAFVKDSSRNRLDFPPTSSYQRLIVHRVAHYFKLDHVVLDVEGGKRAVVLFKTAESRIPILRFGDLIEQPEGPPPKAIKIMRRGQPDQKKTSTASSRGSNSSSSLSSSKDSKDRTLEQREEEYAKARARIFGNEEQQQQQPQPPVIQDVSKLLADTSDQNTIPPKQFIKKEEPQKGVIRPSQNDSFEYNRNADTWNRLWSPPNADNYYANYEHYDPNLLNYRAAPYFDNAGNPYPNYLDAAFPPLYPQANYPPTKKSPTAQPRTNDRIHANVSPPPPNSYYNAPRVPPPIIYSYPNEDVWSFYAPTPSPYNPVYMPPEANIGQPYYYDANTRRTQKSSPQLFDPNAQISGRKFARHHSSGILEEIGSQNFPRSPSHESFFQGSQGAAIPTNTTMETPKTVRNEPQSVGVGGVRLEHILEILFESPEAQIAEIEQMGAIIKRLDGGVTVAIFKTTNAAKQALEREYSGFSLRRWQSQQQVVPNGIPTPQMANLSIQ